MEKNKTNAQLELSGLTSAEVEESRHLHGANLLTPPPREPWWKLYLEKFEDPIIRILLVAAVIAILAGIVEGHYTEGIGIIVAVLLATTLGFFNEYKAGKEFDVLNQVSDEDAVKVIRDGNYTSVPKRDLVVGDVLILEQGEEIPADGEILTVVSFQVNEASLTGESVPVTKRPQSATSEDDHGLAYPRHKVLRGTFVTDGHAMVRVTAVGDNSEIGHTARAAMEETEVETPLNRQLARLSKFIGVCGFSVALLVFSALTVKTLWQGELGDVVVIEQIGSEVNISQPSQDLVEKTREGLHSKYGDIANSLSVQTRTTSEGTEFYLKAPLTRGHFIFLLVATLSVLAALIRIWLPVIHDAIELTGRDRPENAWLEKEGIVPWTQSLFAGIGVFAVGVGLCIAVGWLPSSPSTWLPLSTGMALLRFFMVAVTIIVVAVPEGLPMSVTLSLAYSMRKMTAANNLVRHMHACETIGAATVICSDKTGTLTMNEMHVESLQFTNLSQESIGNTSLEWDLIVEAITANTTAHLGANKLGKLTVPLGNPTESALLLWVEGRGVPYQKRRDEFRMTSQLTFSTERKYMATVGTGILPEMTVMHVKGAPESMLERCCAQRQSDGAIAPLNSEKREEILAVLKSEQARGMRTLGLAYRVVDEASVGRGVESVQELVEGSELIWLGFFSIADPIRPEVPDAITICKHAGVSVKMVTGDTQATACEIAYKIGMVDRNDPTAGIMVTGDEFMAMDEETASRIAKDIRIMSRAKPLAKQRLVNLLQKNGEIVAVTGDGSNDAPALNYADVGLAMGITGTSVAKEAADIILLDDSFASISRAVMWGRSLYANIQKFILFQLTVNVAALGVALLGPFLGVQLPLTVTQMLWVNLIMDTFAALALASEPPDWSLMNKPPRDSEAFIVTPEMAKFILSVGGAFLIVFLVMVLGLGDSFPMDADTSQGRHNLSIFFSIFVFLQFWNLFNAKMLGGIRSVFSNIMENKLFLFIGLFIAFGQILITQFGGEIFRTVPLSVTEWLYIILGTSFVLWIGELFRWRQRLSIRG